MQQESYYASYQTTLGGHYKSVRVKQKDTIEEIVKDEFYDNPQLISAALFKNTSDGESIILRTYDRDDF